MTRPDTEPRDRIAFSLRQAPAEKLERLIAEEEELALAHKAHLDAATARIAELRAELARRGRVASAAAAEERETGPVECRVCGDLFWPAAGETRCPSCDRLLGDDEA